ncbi:TEL2-interacting protein 1 [Borealophlyctis nickersoniae]|nr:TEL2-interacting protein 1 [Borealophlyctis nickersoniae]
MLVAAMSPLTWTSARRNDPSEPLVSLLTEMTAIGAQPDGASIFANKTIVESILYPLVMLLKSDIATTVAVEQALSCLSYLLHTCSPDAVPLLLFRELLVAMPLIMSRGSVGRTGPSKPPSEEVKMLCVQCLRGLIRPMHETVIGESGDELPEVKHPIEGHDDARVSESLGHVARDDQKDLSRSEYQPVLGHCISVLLDVAHDDRNLELRVAAVSAVSEMIDAIRLPDLLALSLPGISSFLTKIAVRDEKENHRLIVACIDTLANLLGRVMADEVNAVLLKNDEVKWSDLARLAKEKAAELDADREAGVLDQIAPTPPRGRPTLKRDREWQRVTVSRLKQALQVVLSIRHHSHWKVRLAFVRFSGSLIRTSSGTLEACVPLLVDTLVLYVEDEYPQVAAECGHQVEAVSAVLQSRHTLSGVLKENFHFLVTSLPRTLRQPDDSKKLEAVRSANGYISLLKENICVTLEASLDRLSLGLLGVLTFNTSDVRVVEDRLVGGRLPDLPVALGGSGVAAKEATRFPKLQFASVHDGRVVQALKQMCRLLGRYGDLAYLADHFLGYVRSTRRGDFQAPALFVLNEMCLGAAGFDVPDIRPEALPAVRAVVKSLARDYLQSDILELPTNLADLESLRELRPAAGIEYGVSNEENETTNVDAFNAGIVKISLILEGLANAALVLGSDFSPLLVAALYPMLEKLGDSNRAVSDAAMSALRVVSQAVPRGGGSTVGELVLANVDYIVNVVSRRLRYVALNPRVPQVLVAAVRVSGDAIVKYMDDTVEEIMDALDDWHTKNERLVVDLLKSLEAVVEALREGKADGKEGSGAIPANIKTQVQNPIGSIEGLPAECATCSTELLEFYLKYKRPVAADDDDPFSTMAETTPTPTIEEIQRGFAELSQNKSGADEVPPSDDDTGEPKESSEEKSPPLTKKQSLALKIINKTSHFLTSASPRLRAQTLHLCSLALPVLASTKELAPQIHTVWPLVTSRLGDTEAWVVEEAVEVIRVCCVLEGTFVRSRVGKDVMPRVLGLMRGLDVARLRERMYHRGVVRMLTALRDVLTAVPISSRDARDVADAILNLVDEDRVGEAISRAAEEVLKAVVAAGGGDAAWVAVWVASGGRRVVHPGNNGLPALDVPKWMRDQAGKGGGATAKSSRWAELRGFVEVGGSVARWEMSQ